jgi:ribosome biogenesis GTPase
VDRCVVVLSATHPDFRPDAADRFLALAELSQIPPVLVLNKVDLLEDIARFEGGIALYREIGYPVLLTSAHTGAGCAELGALLSEGVSLLMGPSGVGKSSLINALDPDFALRVGGVGRTGRGKHTTVGARLLPFASGGWVVDTPGFSDATHVEIELRELGEAFPEMAGLSEGCRFRGCTHLHEPECAVSEAVEEGRIAASRFQSYRSMAGELGDR